MERKALGFLVIASFLAAFAFGVLFSQNAFAQGQNGQRQLPFFPAQSELLSIWTNSTNTWSPADNGHVFSVAADSRGRLPVVTALHSNNVVLYGPDGLIEYSAHIVRVDSGSVAITMEDSVLRRSMGIVLHPGRYVIRQDWNSGYSTDRSLALSGYWANP